MKAEWGSKRVCVQCSTKYYDFNKKPIKCPKCGAEYDLESLLKSSKHKSAQTADKKLKSEELDDEMSHIFDSIDSDFGVDDDFASDDIDSTKEDLAVSEDDDE